MGWGCYYFQINHNFCIQKSNNILKLSIFTKNEFVLSKTTILKQLPNNIEINRNIMVSNVTENCD